MIFNNYRLSVIVITYNQEEVISRALDSIICQKEYCLYDVIVCDDCSSDNTYQVVRDYYEKYPDIIKPFRNEHNLGIYGNCENALTKLGNTDLVIFCAGDDALCDGYLCAIMESISKNNIDVHGEPFTLYSDWAYVNPLGKKLIFRQNIVEKGYSCTSLRLRKLIYNRSTCSSINVYRSFIPVPLDKGILVSEALFEIQVPKYSVLNYYVPIVGSIYYSGIGVSVSKINEIHNNYLDSLKAMRQLDFLNMKDYAFLDYQIARTEYCIRPLFSTFCKTLSCFVRGVEPSYGINVWGILRDFLRMVIKRK